LTKWQRGALNEQVCPVRLRVRVSARVTWFGGILSLIPNNVVYLMNGHTKRRWDNGTMGETTGQHGQ